LSTVHSSQVKRLVHEALAARVGLLLGQTSFPELLAVQDRVSSSLARLAEHKKAPSYGPAVQAQALMQALELDASYYIGSELEFVVLEGLCSAGLVLAEVVSGHEHDSLARWTAEVVPELDRVADFVASVFDGRWVQGTQRMGLSQWMRQPAPPPATGLK
jgi:hypothetical protein